MYSLHLTHDDYELIVNLARGGDLDESPKKNWVENSGGLPAYIEEVAKAIKKSGKTTSQAIAIAISRIKKWAVDPKTDATTKAKAVKAVAQWEALRAKNKARMSAKKVEASNGTPGFLNLCVPSFDVNAVRKAFDKEYGPSYSEGPVDGTKPYNFIMELWTTHLIYCEEAYGDKESEYYKLPYTVSASGEVEFGEAKEVARVYVEVPEDEKMDINRILSMSRQQEIQDRILGLSSSS